MLGMAVVFLVLASTLLGVAIADKTIGYCIIGAGPAGIQLGHFLHHSGRDYVIFESNAHAGSFFDRFPRHRQLISLNKRNVRQGRSAEFAFRHDWNSLIDVRRANRTRPVTQRSKELFPKADVLAAYLREFAEEQHENIRYNAKVRKISRQAVPAGSGNASQVFVVKLEGGGRARCREVIAAHGLSAPRKGARAIDGVQWTESYEDMPETGEAFEGKSVMVLGMGNAALETAQELQKYTAEVHLLARPRPLPEGGAGVRLAYQTHYVGDIRAGRTTILDTYLLKSLDVFDFDAMLDNKMVVIPCKGSRRCIWLASIDLCADDTCRERFFEATQNLEFMLLMGRIASQHEPQVRELLERLAPGEEGQGWQLDMAEQLDPKIESFFSKNSYPSTVDPMVYNGSYTWVMVKSGLLRRNAELMDAMADFRMKYAAKHTRYPVDHVVRCFGWTMDTNMLDSSTRPEMVDNGKYPKISDTFEVQGVPGFFAAGTIAHSLDFRKSAGGFIHGFRYTARCLFRFLEEKNFGVAWPERLFRLDRVDEFLTSPVHSETVPWLCERETARSSGVAGLAQLLIDRVNEASAPYQMFEMLGDMVVFEKNSSEKVWIGRYLEDVPLNHFHHRFALSPRLTWTFRYSEAFHGPMVLSMDRVGASDAFKAHLSNFLHPYMAFFPANASKPAREFWFPEDVHTQWHADEITMPFRNFLARVVNDVIDSEAEAELVT
ncbi:unnamed protein product [Effrenium voratum]|nr:unnamed protein product [Effrenium voratum]|mmetsp:Transcript_80105/g.192151  ORF Transcript_80105/g.192151 Transcript_80105/m.192151 type:complete len:719 (-) Transcript_80105:129-2285(-)